VTKRVEFLPPEYIEAKVHGILCKAQELGFYDFNSPTPLDLIAEKICGFNILFENLDQDLEGILGMLDLENKAIWLDQCLNHFETQQFCDEGRCNFTIAHEIGHYVLDHVSYKDDNMIAFHNELDPEVRKMETQANMFGAMLLMPKELVYRKWNHDFANISNFNDAITAMTDFFRASRETTENRLKTLGLIKNF
jgi:Zn-dependent peptidase ImmA (M78 family)